MHLCKNAYKSKKKSRILSILDKPDSSLIKLVKFRLFNVTDDYTDSVFTNETDLLHKMALLLQQNHHAVKNMSNILYANKHYSSFVLL